MNYQFKSYTHFRTIQGHYIVCHNVKADVLAITVFAFIVTLLNKLYSYDVFLKY